MDIEIMIHGVPDGQDYLGIQEEHDNMGLFYDNSNESVKFVVETKKRDNHAYTYYSYLLYKGIIGAGGRPGSYFGLTLRMDKYYKDASYIYNLLEIIFNKYIVGGLLMPSGDAYKYSVQSFANKSVVIEQVQSAFIELFKMTCVPSKMLDIDGSFIHRIKVAPIGNIFDFNEEAILVSIKKYSKVVLSPDYEMNIEKEYKKKIQDSERERGVLISQRDKKITDQERDINSLNATIKRQESTIATLEQEAKRKDSDIQNQKKKLGDLEQSLAKIKEPITTLANYFHIQGSQNQPSALKYGFKKFILGVACCILTIIAIVLCIIILLRIPEKTSTISQSENPIEMTVPPTNDTLKPDVDNDKPKDGSITSRTIDIDVSPLVTEVEIDQEYTFSVPGYYGGGEWKVDGFSKPNDSKSNVITVKAIKKAKDNDDAVISYTPKKVVKSFKYKSK